MGRLGCDPTIKRFSHPHTLELTPLYQTLTPGTCAACCLRASGCNYSCKQCRYVLHISCAQLPQRIRHPAHAQHTLTLLPMPAYTEGSFNCDACGRNGTGFSYHCQPCSLDLHGLCAAVPLSITHPAHLHTLALTFCPPYGDDGFACNICRGSGSNHWLYRCASCEFDAHIGCATAEAQPQQRAQTSAQFAGIDLVESGDGGVRGDLMKQTLQNFIDGAAQQAGKSFVQNIIGGGGGGGDGGNSVVGDVASLVGGLFTN